MTTVLGMGSQRSFILWFGRPTGADVPVCHFTGKKTRANQIARKGRPNTSAAGPKDHGDYSAVQAQCAARRAVIDGKVCRIRSRPRPSAWACSSNRLSKLVAQSPTGGSVGVVANVMLARASTTPAPCRSGAAAKSPPNPRSPAFQRGTVEISLLPHAAHVVFLRLRINTRHGGKLHSVWTTLQASLTVGSPLDTFRIERPA